MNTSRDTRELADSRSQAIEYLFMGKVLTTGWLYERHPVDIVSRKYATLLGPLPEGYEEISPDMAELPIGMRPWHRNIACVILSVVILVIATLGVAVPWARQPLIALVLPPLAGVRTPGESFQNGVLTVVSVVMLIGGIGLFIALRIWRARIRRSLLRIALSDEQWFRTGSESWTMRQRIISCTVCGSGYILLLVIFGAVAAIPAFILPGIAFMAMYHHVYRRTNDRYLATLESARVSALYREMFGYVLASAFVALSLVTFFQT